MIMDTRSEYSGSNRFLIGFLAGGAIGAALAMVCAPRIGDLRRRVSTSAADLGDRVTRTCQDVSARVTGAVDGLVANGRSVRDDVADVIADGARHVEEVSDGMHVFVSTVDHPTVRYVLPVKVEASSFACLNVRSTNLSSFLEHSLKWLCINEERRDNPWHFDETQKSRPCMNVVTRNQLRAIAADLDAIASFTFSPAARAGEYFVIGCAELYRLS